MIGKIQMVVKEDVTFQLDHGLSIPEYHFVITGNDCLVYTRTGFEGTNAIYQLSRDSSTGTRIAG